MNIKNNITTFIKSFSLVKEPKTFYFIEDKISLLSTFNMIIRISITRYLVKRIIRYFINESKKIEKKEEERVLLLINSINNASKEEKTIILNKEKKRFIKEIKELDKLNNIKR